MGWPVSVDLGVLETHASFWSRSTFSAVVMMTATPWVSNCGRPARPHI